MDTFMHLFLTEEEKLPFYVKVVGGYKNQPPIMRNNGYTDYQWIHCVKGKGRLLIDNREFIIGKNMGIFLPPFQAHEYYAIEDSWETHWVAFSGFGVPHLLQALGLNKYGIFSFSDIRFLDSCIIDIFNTAKANTPSSGYRCSGKLYNLLMEIKNAIRENNTSIENSKYSKVRQVITFIESSYDKELTIENLASEIDVSPQYLCRIFKEIVNIRPFAYLTKYRLQKSKEILINDYEAKIADVARKVGYNDESYYSMLFKKNEGTTPSEFRIMNKLF